MSKLRVVTQFSAAGLALVCASSGIAQSNLLNNARFENRLQVQTTQVRSCEDASSAKGWVTWIQAIGCVPDSGVELETDVVPTQTLSFGPPRYMMHVRARQMNPLGMGNAGYSGIAQTLAPSTGYHTRVLASVWVLVVRGAVGMGVGYNGTAKPSNRSTKAGEWEQLVGVSETDPPNQFVVYGIHPNGSEFYVTDAVVCPADTDAELESCRQLVAVSSPPAARN